MTTPLCRAGQAVAAAELALDRAVDAGSALQPAIQALKDAVEAWTRARVLHEAADSLVMKFGVLNEAAREVRRMADAAGPRPSASGPLQHPNPCAWPAFRPCTCPDGAPTTTHPDREPRT